MKGFAKYVERRFKSSVISAFLDLDKSVFDCRGLDVCISYGALTVRCMELAWSVASVDWLANQLAVEIDTDATMQSEGSCLLWRVLVLLESYAQCVNPLHLSMARYTRVILCPSGDVMNQLD